MMKILNFVWQIVYRVWFYLLVALPILLFFPVLILLTARASWYRSFYWVARNIWARCIIFGMGWVPRLHGSRSLLKGSSCVLVANHTSMSDIMLMLWVSSDPFVFVGKKELSKIPVFGFFYKRVCILVDRSSAKSRTAVYKRAQRTLQQGLNVCIFPEGGVPDDESVILDTFKDGAFRLAIEHQIPIVPMVFCDNKRRFPYSLSKGSPGRMRVQLLPLIETRDKDLNNLKELRTACFQVMWDGLTQGCVQQEPSKR